MSKRPHMQQRIDRDRLDTFAELVANGSTLGAASKVVGVSPQRGSQLFAQIRQGLGWQAI